MEDEDERNAASTALAVGPYFLGSVSVSLGHLPPWYQLLALCGVFAVIYLRNNMVIRWLIVQLHSSTGTEAMWVDSYKTTLRAMSFTERLCFTLYGVTLGALVFVLFRIFCQDSVNIGSNVGQLFPDKRFPTVVMVVLMCVVDAVRLRSAILEVLNTPNSLANLAMNHFADIDKTDFDPSLSESNAHFVIQFELFRSFILFGALRRLPVMVMAAVYRLSRDAPRKAHVALRWYMATFAVFFLLQELLSMYVRYSWTDVSAWAMIAWALTFLGVVNFIYGPAKRAGTVVTISATNSVTEAVRGLVTCCALWFIASLIALAVIVSVHEELVLIWLFMSLMILWTPAIIDACSTDYMFFLSTSAAAVQYAMLEDSTIPATIRFAVLMFLWWLVTALVYNAALHLSVSRYIAGAVAICFVLWILSPPAAIWSNAASMAELHLEESFGVVDLFSARVTWLRAVASFGPLPADSWMYASANGDGQQAFDLLLHECAGMSLVCVAVSSLIQYSLSPKVQLYWRRHEIVSATPAVLLRKFLRTFVLATCVGGSITTWSMVRFYLLPMWTRLLPDFIAKGLCSVAAVTALGNLMDMQESMYDACVRVLGMRDPLALAEMSSETVEEPPLVFSPRTPRSRTRDRPPRL